jgi:hypothetical protein
MAYLRTKNKQKPRDPDKTRRLRAWSQPVQKALEAVATMRDDDTEDPANSR